MNIKVELLKHELTRVINEQLEDFEIDATEIADTTAVKLVGKIQNILKTENDDFMIVEKIVELFEENKIDCSPCHDFG